MNIKVITVAIALAGAVCLNAQTADTDSRFMRPFTEDFSSSKPNNFTYSGTSFRYNSGVSSFTEKDTHYED